MENNINNDKILTHECNELSNLLNTTKRKKSKNSHYSPILKGCMNNRSGTAKFRNFRIILDSGNSSTIVIGKLTSKLKENPRRNNYMGNPNREVHDLK